MPEGNGEGRPGHELTIETPNWYDKPHDELVKAFRGYVEKQTKTNKGLLGFSPPPAELLHKKLANEFLSGAKRRADFFFPIAKAYDIIAYDQFEPGSMAEMQAGDGLWIAYQPSQEKEGVPAIRLPDPLQVKILDALADASDVPHKSGQELIPIPPMFYNYPAHCMTSEYRDRAKAVAEKRKAEGHW